MNKNTTQYCPTMITHSSEKSLISSNVQSGKTTTDFKMKEVQSRKQAKLFRDFPDQIHNTNTAYIKPLNKDIEAVFDPKKNKFFQHGICSRWLLYDKNQVLIGRIAVFINYEYHQVQQTGGIGFFDCIDNTLAAHFMFDHCKQWLQQHSIEAMDGPINFGERLNWWGLLIEGFQSPIYGMNYHPPYYQQLFESYGFQVYFNQHCYGIPIQVMLPAKFYRIRDNISKDNKLKAVAFSKKKIDQFAQDFTYIYNKAWENHGEGKKMEIAEAIKLFRTMKAVIDEHAICFVYYDEQPIACWLNLPDLNIYFKSMNGKFGPLSIIKFLLLKRFRPNRKLIGLLFGIVPEFQNKGIDAFMIVNALQLINANTDFQDYEMQWIGDFNPRMINIAKNMGAVCTRRLATYRYLFDNNRVFLKHPIVSN